MNRFIRPVKNNRSFWPAALAAILILSAAWPAAAGEVIRVAAMGDVMLGTENMLPEDGGAGSFAAVRPLLADRDVVFCNYEGTLTDRGEPTKVFKDGYAYIFRTPPSYARFLAEAGVNMVSIANNHINDYGPIGKQDTIDTLTRAGIAWSGPPDTAARLTVRGLRVAMIAFHTSSHSHWMLDIPEAKRMVGDLARQNEIVIVSFHGGMEGSEAVRTPRAMEYYHGEKRGEVVRFSRAMIEAGADLVLGHGPHVPRAAEVYRGRLIAYSLGNFCTGKGINVKGVTGYAPLLLAELDARGRLTGGRVVSFLQDFGRHPHSDTMDSAVKLMYDLGRQDFPRSNALRPDGGLKPAPVKKAKR
ncbi:MAG: CapA family protein [Proteobacteria bacterium]|nr:CapA family protein [Pseudomonadota bacterium]